MIKHQSPSQPSGSHARTPNAGKVGEMSKFSEKDNKGLRSASRVSDDIAAVQKGPTPAAMAEDVTSTATSFANDISQAAKSATAAAKQQAGELASHIGTELGATAEEQKQHGAEAIKGFGRAIDSAARELESQSPAIAGYIHDAARQVQTLGGNLANRNINALMREVSDLARSRPTLFFGGAVAAGVILARFLKSSAPRQTADRGRRTVSRS